MQTRRYLIYAVIASTAVHAVVAFLLYKHKPARRAFNEKIEISFMESSTSTDSRTESKSIAAGRADSSTKSVHGRPKQMKDILSGGFRSNTLSKIGDVAVRPTNEIGTNHEGPFEGDPMKYVGPASHGWSGAVQYGNAMSLPFTLETLPFFTALFDRVNALLVYPDDFSRQRITGSVRIEAELTKDGRLVKFLSTTADDRLLQTYCFAFLMQALARPLPPGTWLEQERAIVAFDFTFQTRLTNQPRREFAITIQKNRLAFGRENEVEPWMMEKIHETFTHYVPPIIVYPGGFYIDFVMAYEHVRNLVEGNPTESERRQVRIDEIHQFLKQAIRAQPSPTASPTPPES